MTALASVKSKLIQIGRSAAGVGESAMDLELPYQNLADPNFYSATPLNESDVAFIGVSANDLAVPVDAMLGTQIFTATPVGTTTWSSGVFKTQGFGRVVGTIASNDAGTLTVKFSNDGQNFDAVTTVSVTGSTLAVPVGQPFSVEVVGLYCELTFAPTGSNTLLRIYPLLRRLGSA